MTVTDAIAGVYLRATRKATTLATSSAKYAQILALLNYWQRRWASERGVDWNSLYNPTFSIGTVTATDAFDLDTSSIRKISGRLGDPVRIVWTDDQTFTDYDIVPADKLKDYYAIADKSDSSYFVCAHIGAQIVFSHKFASTNDQFGGDIQVPCYVFTDSLVNATDEIQVDDPDWLVAMCAADYVRNDVTRRALYPQLLAEANEIMQRMKDDQEGQIVEIDRPWTPLSGIGTDSAWS